MFVVGYWLWRNIVEDPLKEDPHHYLCSSNLSMFISSCYNWLASKTWDEWPLKVAELHIICGFSINARADCTFLKTWDRYASAFLLGGFNQSSILNPNHQSDIVLLPHMHAQTHQLQMSAHFLQNRIKNESFLAQNFVAPSSDLQGTVEERHLWWRVPVGTHKAVQAESQEILGEGRQVLQPAGAGGGAFAQCSSCIWTLHQDSHTHKHHLEKTCRFG